ncbi:MAG: tyrosine-type recombinase/integrase [Caldilineaceae bacterium]
MQEQVEQFLEHLSSKKKSSTHTTLAYRNDLSQLVEFVQLLTGSNRQSVKTWKQITPAHVQAYVAFIKAQDYATSTVARKLAAVRSLFEWMVGQGALSPSLVKLLAAPKVKRSAPSTLSQEEIERLLKAPAEHQSLSGLRDRAMFELLYATGMRVSELVGLNVNDIELAKQSLLIDRGGTRSRCTQLNPTITEILRAYLTEARPYLLLDAQEPSLFVNQRGQRLTRQGLWLLIKQYVQQAGIKKTVTPHVLRHSFIANQLEKGTQPRDIRQAIGNSSPISTQAYKTHQGGHQLIIDGKVMERET